MAVTLTAAELEAAIGSDTATATRLLAVVSELVAKEAPDAPAAIQNEAAIRAAGWLRDMPAASIRSEQAGPLQADYSPSMLSALRHSGAKALLSPWKVRRAGAIG